MNYHLKNNKLLGVLLSLILFNSCQCFECSEECIGFLLHNGGTYCKSHFDNEMEYNNFIDSMEAIGYARYPEYKTEHICNKEEKSQLEKEGLSCQETY